MTPWEYCDDCKKMVPPRHRCPGGSKEVLFRNPDGTLRLETMIPKERK